MSVNKYLEALGMPFPADKVKWRLQSTNKDKTMGYAVPYLDSRAIAERLDNVVGQMNWHDEYKPWANTKEGASQLCTIYIYDEERKEWIGKTDGASMSQIEPVKGGISDAFKRAAVKWNIGRYLYRFQVVKVRTKPKGSSAVIDYSEMPRLNQYYIETLKKLGILNKLPANQQTVPAAQTPAVPAQTAPKTAAVSPAKYEILGVKQQQGINGVHSVLQIRSGGKTVTAYYNGTDANLKRGAKLGKAAFSMRQTPTGNVHILTGYEMAA